MRKSLLAVTLLAFTVAGTTACATKGYVKNQVGQVSNKVDTLSTSLEDVFLKALGRPTGDAR